MIWYHPEGEEEGEFLDEAAFFVFVAGATRARFVTTYFSNLMILQEGLMDQGIQVDYIFRKEGRPRDFCFPLMFFAEGKKLLGF